VRFRPSRIDHHSQAVAESEFDNQNAQYADKDPYETNTENVGNQRSAIAASSHSLSNVIVRATGNACTASAVVYARADFLPPPADGAATQEVVVDAATGAAAAASSSSSGPAVGEDGSLLPDANGLLPGPVWVDVPVEALVETFTRYFNGDLPQTTAAKKATKQPAANSE